MKGRFMNDQEGLFFKEILIRKFLLNLGKFMKKIPMLGTLVGTVLSFSIAQSFAQTTSVNGVTIGERPVIEKHLDQFDIEAGVYSFDEIFDFGADLFRARFNTLDGQGRPATTGTGAPRVPDEPRFIRSSAPDANSCFSCHLDPGSGGNGDFAVNVFVLAQAADPVTFDISASSTNNRNTVGMNGAGAIEMLAVEMSEKLISIREKALKEAKRSGLSQTRKLIAKGVDFGTITVLPNGMVDPTGIDGVDWDLIIKPFHQKGAVVSLREFTNNAMNHHHGMQSVERFGEGLDPDLDNVFDELTIGDITATSIYQAGLEVPTQVMPEEPERQRAVNRGFRTFKEIGCADCHRPKMRLKDPYFHEPNKFNPAGNAGINDIATYSFNMVTTGKGNRLEPGRNGGAIVRAFTDLKRHNLCDDDYNHFCNELLPQGNLAGFADPASFTVAVEPRPTEEFISRRLWDAGSSDPYGHVGDLTTLSEAISEHGGDGRVQRDAFFNLSERRQAEIIEFLKSLQIVL